MKEAIIEDEELGRLIVRVNLRAKSLVFRTKSDAVYVSVPSGTTMKEVKRAIEDLRSKLLASRKFPIGMYADYLSAKCGLY